MGVLRYHHLPKYNAVAHSQHNIVCSSLGNNLSFATGADATAWRRAQTGDRNLGQCKDNGRERLKCEIQAR